MIIYVLFLISLQTFWNVSLVYSSETFRWMCSIAIITFRIANNNRQEPYPDLEFVSWCIELRDGSPAHLIGRKLVSEKQVNPHRVAC